jgi:hypothetical protein
MNGAYISALAALAGSGIGALASVGTTWLTQRHHLALLHHLLHRRGCALCLQDGLKRLR